MIRIAIVTISDSAVAGTREDRSGPALAARVAELGWMVSETMTVPDEIDGIIAALEKMSGAEVGADYRRDRCRAARCDLDYPREFSKREIPGLGEMMRAEGRKSTEFAPLSRGVAVTRGRTLVVNLPGSPRGAVQSLDVIADLIPHIVSNT